MKPGICIYFDSQQDMDQKFAMAVKEGFDNCQLLSWHPEDWTDNGAALIRNCIKKYGITLSAFWCGWEGPTVWDFYEGPTTLGLLPEEYREMRVKNLCDGADFAKKLGVTDIITHMGFIPENPNDSAFSELCDAIKQVAVHLEQNNQFLLFETGQETPVAMLRCFEQVGTNNLGVNLDTGNLILYGKANPVDSLDVIGRYVRNVHAKDGYYPTNGHDLGREVRVGEGKVDFVQLIKKLKELNYDGPLTIEREIDGTQQTEDIRFARKYLLKIINEVCEE